MHGGQNSGRARCSGDRSHTRYRGTCDTCSQEGHPAAGAQAAHDSPVTNRIGVHASNACTRARPFAYMIFYMYGPAARAARARRRRTAVRAINCILIPGLISLSRNHPARVPSCRSGSHVVKVVSTLILSRVHSGDALTGDRERPDLTILIETQMEHMYVGETWT